VAAQAAKMEIEARLELAQERDANDATTSSINGDESSDQQNGISIKEASSQSTTSKSKYTMDVYNSISLISSTEPISNVSGGLSISV